MLSPNTGQPMRLVEGAPATYTLRGEQFRVGGPAWECPAAGERYTTNDQDFDVVGRLHHAWRERHGIAPAALQRRGKALGLSDAQASALLGFGVNQYRTYKTTDKLPSKSNARLLQMLCDERALPALLEAAGDALTAATRRKLAKHLAQRAGQPAAAARPQLTTRPLDRAQGAPVRTPAQNENTHVKLDLDTALNLETDVLRQLVGSAGDYSYAMAA